ncbi:MAG TPA: hypothetical protein PK358_18090, partial [Spirochaetota bacterium]|nr:hypothetical protein [Spirochaetota bacterium]
NREFSLSERQFSLSKRELSPSNRELWLFRKCPEHVISTTARENFNYRSVPRSQDEVEPHPH